MKYILQTITFIFLISTYSKAQQQIQLLYHPFNWQQAVSMKHAVGGGFILVSNITDNLGESAILITRFGNLFNVVWEKEVNEQGVAESANSFFQDSDGNIFIGGQKSGTGILLFKTDSSGNIIWSTDCDLSSSTKSLMMDGNATEGVFILAAKDGNIIPNDTVIAIKCDTSGNFQWVKSVFETVHMICPLVMTFRPNKFGVSFLRYGLSSNSTGLQYFDDNGNATSSLWLTGYPLNVTPEINEIAPISNGGLLILGNCFTNFDPYPCMGLIDQSGNISRSQAFDHFGNFLRGVQTNDGGFAVLAKLTSANGNLIKLIKVDSTLTLQWSMEYHNSGIEGGASLLVTADSGFCISGYNSLAQIVIIKTDSLGNSYCSDSTFNMGYLPGTMGSGPGTSWPTQQQSFSLINYNPQNTTITNNSLDTLCLYTSTRDLQPTNNFTLYPNPASAQFTFVSKEVTKKEIEIFNLLGEKIYSASTNLEQLTVNCELFPKGIYFVKVFTQNMNMVRKFIKE